MTGYNIDEKHLVSYSAFIWVWIGLIMLTFITVGASMLFPGVFGVIVAVIVTPIKVLLVLEIFMHLRFEKKVFRFMFLSAVVIMAVFMGLTFLDYFTR